MKTNNEDTPEPIQMLKCCRAQTSANASLGVFTLCSLINVDTCSGTEFKLFQDNPVAEILKCVNFRCCAPAVKLGNQIMGKFSGLIFKLFPRMKMSGGMHPAQVHTLSKLLTLPSSLLHLKPNKPLVPYQLKDTTTT